MALTFCALLNTQTDKSAYHLFNPVPPELMRPMSADRPDATESPITVDAGHFQLELSFFDFSRDDFENGDFEAWTLMDANFKIGLLPNVDLQFVFSLYNEETIDTGIGPASTTDGFGDVQIRAQRSIYGAMTAETPPSASCPL